jgi:hypothetical protein
MVKLGLAFRTRQARSLISSEPSELVLGLQHQECRILQMWAGSIYGLKLPRCGKQLNHQVTGLLGEVARLRSSTPAVVDRHGTIRRASVHGRSWLERGQGSANR